LYRIGNEWRYIEYTSREHHRHFQVSSVGHSRYLQHILELSRSGAFLREFDAYVRNSGFSEEDTSGYLGSLVDAGILLSELEPSVVGNDYWDTLLEVASRLGDDLGEQEGAFIRTLWDIRDLLGEIQYPEADLVRLSQVIVEKITSLQISFEENKVFQVDAFEAPGQCLLDKQIQADLTTAFSIFNRLNPYIPNPRLHSFNSRFRDRFGDRPMPLLQVIDAESGIGYDNFEVDIPAPLIEGVPSPSAPRRQQDAGSLLSEGKVLSFLRALLEKAIASGLYSVEISDKDLQSLPFELSDLPPTMSVMFRLISSERQNLFVEGFSGSSGANLLGRFCYGNEDIHQLVTGIASHESLRHPDAIIAEIDHLPDDRTGNILRRPSFREYRIPILSGSSGTSAGRISLKELWVRIVDGQVCLFWEKTQQEVIPRLSTAHNYTRGTLDLYQFLCDLQSRRCRTSLGFSWKALSDTNKFLPRVYYKNIVLSPAQWTLERADYESLLRETDESMPGAWTAFREKWKMPSVIVLVEGDHELLVDMGSPITVLSFISQLKKKGGILIKEFLNYTHPGIRNKEGERYANQFVASILFQDKKPALISPLGIRKKEVQRTFIPGTEWLYYKFYCGIQFADNILLTVVKPFLAAQKRRGAVDAFFFTRYNDPDYHLRLRFHVSSIHLLYEIMADMRQRVRKFEKAGIIWKVQIDTYDREIERYGSNTIHMVEQLFYYDSQAVLKFLSSCSGDQREEFRWLWGVKAIDEILNSLRFSLLEKIAIVTSVKDNFDKEFQADKSVNTLFNKKYADNKALVSTVLQEEYHLFEAFKPLAGILVQWRKGAAPLYRQILDMHLKGKLEMDIQALAVSIIHMFLNRHLLAQPRKHEWLMYKMLEKHYKTRHILDAAGRP